MATEIISKKGDICTDNVQDCNTTGFIQNQNGIFKLEIRSKIPNTDILKEEEYYLFDIYGRLIINGTSFLEVENELKTLPIGVYFLSTRSENSKIKSEKIFNNKIK